MAKSVCSFQPAIAIIPWVKPSNSVTTIKTPFSCPLFSVRVTRDSLMNEVYVKLSDVGWHA
jgi:hypothetical protein